MRDGLAIFTLVDRDEVGRRKRGMFSWERHVLLVLPLLPVELYRVDGRGDLARVDRRTEALVGRTRAVRRLRDVGARTVRVHEA